jgi:hypothetical protein
MSPFHYASYLKLLIFQTKQKQDEPFVFDESKLLKIVPHPLRA